MHGYTHICMTRTPSHVDRHKNESQIRTRRLFGENGIKMNIIS